jgi:signal recognition particle receptor subunit beta
VVFFNYTTMQITAKIVYYGPGLCGKTTNLQFIHHKTAGKSRGEMVSLETETDRTLFFDLLPLDVGVIGGMKVRLQLYTVPGQVFYNATRKLVLKGVDGIVFVADSQVAMLDANVESLKNLETNLAELGLKVDQVPLVFQYNKRDIRNIQPVDTLNRVLNRSSFPFYEAAALHGIGVFETLKGISRLALTAVRRKVQSDESRRKTSGAEAAAPSPPLASRPSLPAPPQVPLRPPPPSDPFSELVPDVPLPDIPPVPDSPVVPDVPEEVPVEFAEEDTDRHLRAVETKGNLDIQDELEKLRTLTLAAPAKGAGPAGAKEAERRLQNMLVSDREARQEVKRKASIEVPAALLKDSATLSLHLAFDGSGREELVRDAVTVKLFGNRRLERLILHIDLELRGKS